MSRTDGRVVVKPAARRIWRMGGRRSEGWRGEGSIADLLRVQRGLYGGYREARTVQ